MPAWSLRFIDITRRWISSPVMLCQTRTTAIFCSCLFLLRFCPAFCHQQVKRVFFWIQDAWLTLQNSSCSVLSSHILKESEPVIWITSSSLVPFFLHTEKKAFFLATCSVAVKLLDLDPQGRWFDPWCGHDKICTAVGPLSKALNPTLLQGECLLLSLINCKSLWIKALDKCNVMCGCTF